MLDLKHSEDTNLLNPDRQISHYSGLHFLKTITYESNDL